MLSIYYSQLTAY